MRNRSCAHLSAGHCLMLPIKDKTYFSRGWRAIDEWSPEGLQALEMIAMHMAQEAGQRCWSLRILAKIVD